MGSWNISCFISGISIGGCEDVYYIPLALNSEPDTSLKHAAKYGLMYPTNFYSPATFPILGKYDTYGGLEDIVRDKNVEHLEKVYKMPIEKILSNESKLFDGGVFVIKEIYDTMVFNFVGEYGPSKNKTYEVDERVKKCGNYGYLVKSAIKRRVTSIKQYKLIKSRKDQPQEVINECIRLIRKEAEEIRDIRGSFDVEFRLDGGVLFPLMPKIKELYFNKIVNGTFSQQLLDINMLYIAMYATGKQYFPTVNGLQGGNDYMVKKLAMVTNKFLTARIKERNQY